MTTKAGVGFSQKLNSKEAGIEATQAALATAGVERCDLVILFAGTKHDPVLLREGVRSIVGVEPRLFGGGVVGVITNEKLGCEGYEVGVAVISSETMKIDMFIAKNLVISEFEAGLSLGKQIKNNKSAGDPNILLVYDVVKSGLGSEASSLTMATALLAGMTESLEKWPTAAGCGIMANIQWTPPFQYFDNEIENQSAMALVLSGATRMDTMIMHGCKPASRYFTVTKADRNVVLELDGRPALDVLQDLVGDSDKNWQDYPIYITLGVNQGDKFGDYKEEEYAVRLCADLDRERRGLVMFGDDLVPGSEVQLMRRSINFDYITLRSEQLISQIGSRKPFLALYIDCVGRMSAYSGTDQEDAEEVQKVLASRIPLLGWYTGCEIAKAGPTMQSHNWTGVLCLLSE